MKSNLNFLFKTLLTLLICSWSFSVFTKEVDISTAKRVAINWFTERAEKTVSDIRITKIIEEKENEETIFYVMIFSEKGFVLIAADDIVKPVLGYSIKSNYAEGNHSPAFEFYILKRFRKQIYAAKQAKITTTEETVLEWQRLSASPESFQPKNVKGVSPLLTSIWGQDWPFNAYCPYDINGPSDHAVTGCVATAMAQVLNYWQHPWHGTGSRSYTPEDHPEYGVQFADFGNTTYNFDNMPDTATALSDDLATLMYHCGVSVDMNYGPDGSGAWGWGNHDVSDALKDYFYFDGFAHHIVRSSHVFEWADMMRDNLNHYWPVIYAAEDNQADAGHAWVLDGYTDGDYFHCNWGWSGDDDGYYSIDDFSPPGSGHTYDMYECACSGVYPKVDYPTGTWTLVGSPYYIDYDQVISEGNELTIEPGVEIIFNGRYHFLVYGELNAVGTEPDTIIFTASDTTIGWHGIRFMNTNNNPNDTSILKYCKLEYGKALRSFVHTNEGLFGGAVYCYNASNVIIENCLIQNNSAFYHGGGIQISDTSNISLNNCLITDNSAIHGGGGIMISFSGSELTNITLTKNSSDFGHGTSIEGIYSFPTIKNSEIYDNTGEHGAISFGYSDVIMDSVIIHGNTATLGEGGGIYAVLSNLDLKQVQIYKNTAEFAGGGIYLELSNADMENVTIYHNDALFSAGGITMDSSTSTLVNCIVWGNSPIAIDTIDGSSLYASYSDIEGGWTGTGNIDANPLFVSPYYNDLHLSWSGYPMPDGDKSPCIDTGDPASPYDPDGTSADMGALPYEQIYTSIAGGDISGTLTCAGSPYFVDGDLLVPAGDQLIIEPCVYVMARGDYKLSIEGQILAEGTGPDKITFACLDTIAGWKGLRFVNLNSNGQDSSKLVDCRISWGDADGIWGAENGGGLYFYHSSKVRVENCLISKNNANGYGGGIDCYYSAPLFINNTITNNTADLGGGIYSSSGIKISGGLISDNYANGGGGCYFYYSSPELSGITIRNNTAVTGGGLLLNGTANPVFDPVNRCNIFSNHAFADGLDIYVSPPSTQIINIVADTLSVLYPNDYFIYPVDHFTFDFLNYVIEQENQDLYVATTGSDENSGTSPSEPLQTIHMALKKIMADTLNPRNIYLENGTYSESSTGEFLPINPRSFVSLTGTDRDGTIIYGEEKSRLFYGYNDNYFTIQNMHLQGGYGLEGGAVYLLKNSSPEITNVKISDSEAYESGGGLYCTDGSTPHLTHVEFLNNTAGDYGGGMMCYWWVHPVLKHVDFILNEAGAGGGIAAQWSCDIKLDSCLIANNTALNAGGIYFYKSTANSVISNSEICFNQAANDGGGVMTWDSHPVFNNVEINNNTAEYYGGGIRSGGHSYPVFNNIKISGNTALSNGGGMSLGGHGNHKFYNTLITDNTAPSGAGINLGGDAEFINVTVTGNSCTSGNGGAVYNNAPNTVFLNSIIWDNFPDEFYVNTGTVTAEYSDIKDSWPGTGNIDADPVFNPANFKLLSSSPCIDAGNPDTTGLSLPLTDLAGNPRISNDTIDMGAYEFFQGIELALKVFFEGPFNGTDMNTAINDFNILPLSQPYNESPWNYAGMENVFIIPNADVVDWVLIELRDTTNADLATGETRIARFAGFLLNDGAVVGLDGDRDKACLVSAPQITNNLFVVIQHRNHLGILSAFPLTETGGVYSYDYTTSAGQAYNSGQKEIVSGVWGMIASDADASGLVDETDKSDFWEIQSGSKGYLNDDMNLDAEVNNQDKNDYWLPNQGAGTQVPE